MRETLKREARDAAKDEAERQGYSTNKTNSGATIKDSIV